MDNKDLIDQHGFFITLSKTEDEIFMRYNRVYPLNPCYPYSPGMRLRLPLRFTFLLRLCSANATDSTFFLQE